LGREYAFASGSNGAAYRLDLLDQTAGAMTNRLAILNNGNVGIGTTSPGHKLELRTSSGYVTQAIIANDTSYSYVRTANATTGTTFGNEGATGAQVIVGGLPYASVINQTAAYALHLGTNNTARMTIDSSGNVGIGTASPDTKFESVGTIRSTGSTGKYTDLVVDSTSSYLDASHGINVRTNGATSYLTAAAFGTDGGVKFPNIKSGATQAAAGAAATEIWKTASHATLPDNVLMIGV